MNDIFKFDDVLMGGNKNEIYRSKPIKISERSIMQYGLPAEVHVVTDKHDKHCYSNRVVCCTLPEYYCRILGVYSRTRNGYITEKETALKEALKLEERIREIMKEAENKVCTISVDKAKQPMHMIYLKEVRKRYTLVAGEIQKNGDIGINLDPGIAKEHPITHMTPWGTSRMIYPYGGPAGFIRFNISELHHIIQEVEEEASVRYYTTDHVFVNAFMLGNWTGIKKGEGGDRFEVPIDFYKIRVEK